MTILNEIAHIDFEILIYTHLLGRRVGQKLFRVGFPIWTP